MFNCFGIFCLVNIMSDVQAFGIYFFLGIVSGFLICWIYNRDELKNSPAELYYAEYKRKQKVKNLAIELGLTALEERIVLLEKNNHDN